MLSFTKKKYEYVFLESDKFVSVYKKIEKKIIKVSDFNIDALSTSVENLKKTNPDIVNSKNTWLLEAKSENIEKAPSLTKEELHSYVSWKIQEIIDVSLHDIYYDVLTNNEINSSFFSKYSTVIIHKKNHINEITSVFNKLKINLSAIDYTATAMLDFFKREKEITDGKSLAFLRFFEKKVAIYIYADSGLVFDRIVELPINNENISEDEYKSLIDKLFLEIQRNIDYIDRQLSIQPFETIIFSSNLINAEKIKKDIINFFDVKELDLKTISDIELEDNIPVELIAYFEREKYSKETINLIQKKDIKTNNEEFTKLTLSIVLSGLIIALIGSVYEFKAKNTIEENSKISKDIEKIGKDIAELKGKEIVADLQLEKEIFSLRKNKEEILKIQNQDLKLNEKLYRETIRDLAVNASKNGIILTNIKINNNGIMLDGIIANKNLFGKFLKDLQKVENLAGQSLSTINFQQLQNYYAFRVSSENMGN